MIPQASYYRGTGCWRQGGGGVGEPWLPPQILVDMLILFKSGVSDYAQQDFQTSYGPDMHGLGM